MAPEQFEGEHSAASDIYALSLVACEMLCGYPDSRALSRELSSETRDLLDSALVFRAEDRPTDIRSWSAQLANAIGSGRRSRWQMRWWVAVAAVAVLAVGVQAARTFGHLAGRLDASRFRGPLSTGTPIGVGSRLANGSEAIGTMAVTRDLTGNWTVTGILVICGFMCNSPVGTVLHSTAAFVQDTPTAFHGTYFDSPIQGTVSGSSISLGFDNLHVPAMIRRGNCTGTIAGTAMTLNCSEYLKPNADSVFLLNGTRTDTVVKQ
jgi:serine/threonine protein kinase